MGDVMLSLPAPSTNSCCLNFDVPWIASHPPKCIGHAADATRRAAKHLWIVDVNSAGKDKSFEGD
ncbi:hypothetical protein NXC24_PC00270 (plasmid) [Rhizobium sp. NXC24]|nr:hypothetical protein NXC24_PC00270 [Rhizobium sp. NXC24]